MIKRKRLLIWATSALLGIGALSGCEKVDGDAGAKQDAAGTEAGGEETAPAEVGNEPADVTDAQGDEGGAVLDDASLPDDGAGGDTLNPDDGGGIADPDSADDGQFSVLPTDHCPIDIPAPFTPHALDSEERGDGNEVYCIAHVSSKGDPVYLEQDIAEQFKGHNAEQLEKKPADDPYDPDDISIQAWLYEGYEVIVNMRYVGPTGVNLVYVVRAVS